MLMLTPIVALVSLQNVSFCHSCHHSVSLLFLKRSACSCKFSLHTFKYLQHDSVKENLYLRWKLKRSQYDMTLY